jgi:hypothetical protein
MTEDKRKLIEELDKLPFGVRADGKDVPEHEHFFKCGRCGRKVDMRDLGDVFFHEDCPIGDVA